MVQLCIKKKNKEAMKRFWITLISSLIISIPAMADDDKPVEVSKMPSKAQEFISTYFPGNKVAVAKQEGRFILKSYDVIFINGDKVEFDRNGNWTNVECKYTKVPDGITPQPIDSYIKTNYPQSNIKAIEKEERHYDVELDNGTDLKFNFSYKLIKID